MNEGIVIKSHSGVYAVHLDNRIVECSLRGNLKKTLEYSTSQSSARRVTKAKRSFIHDTITVGDRVRFTEADGSVGVIEEVLPRATKFGRSGFRGKEQNLVCNLDLLLVVFASAEPNPDPWKLDRFLMAAEAEEIEAVIVANKADLLPEGSEHEVFEEFMRAGYRVIFTSAKTGAGIDDLRQALAGRVSAVTGPSGAGKSSLLNAIEPSLNLRTGDIGYVTFKGRHTTTQTQLVPLTTGGWVADTPGLRQLDLLPMTEEELAWCFPELRAHLGGCRFKNCRHMAEPGCALKLAAEQGIVSERRLKSLQTLIEGLSTVQGPRS